MLSGIELHRLGVAALETSEVVHKNKDKALAAALINNTIQLALDVAESDNQVLDVESDPIIELVTICLHDFANARLITIH